RERPGPYLVEIDSLIVTVLRGPSQNLTGPLFQPGQVPGRGLPLKDVGASADGDVVGGEHGGSRHRGQCHHEQGGDECHATLSAGRIPALPTGNVTPLHSRMPNHRSRLPHWKCWSRLRCRSVSGPADAMCPSAWFPV